MTYNFDEIIDRRNTNSENVEGWRPYIFHCGPERVFPYKDEEFIRMWVADMEFAVAPEILQAIRQTLTEHFVYDESVSTQNGTQDFFQYVQSVTARGYSVHYATAAVLCCAIAASRRAMPRATTSPDRMRPLGSRRLNWMRRTPMRGRNII